MEISDRMEKVIIFNPVRYEKLDLYILAEYVDDVRAALETMRLRIRWDQVICTLGWSQEAKEQDRARQRQRQRHRERR